MDFEQAIETQRLRLLRLLAGLVVAVGVLSVGPVSRGFSLWVCGFVSSILSRAELAARYLVIAQARCLAVKRGLDVACVPLSEASRFAAPRADVSLAEVKARLRALRAVLSDLPRHARRLLNRIEKSERSAACAGAAPLRFVDDCCAVLADGRLVGNRIERPPDRILPVLKFHDLPPVSGREAKEVGRCIAERGA